MKDEASYVCESCGEEIVMPVDVSAGSAQEYVEDCPVCCCPNVIHVEVDEDGDVPVQFSHQHHVGGLGAVP
jgi:Cysteine-rich CPXCG